MYVKSVHNQKYCSPECCRIATNARLIQQYHDRKAQKSGGKRVCKRKDCNTILSMYNTDDICGACQEKRLDKRLKRWGWQ